LTQPIDKGEEPVLYGVTHEKPIYFLSYKLSSSQQKWPTCQREMYAIRYALQKLDPYLHNAQFTIKTDHKPLKYVLESPMTNKQMQLWALELSNYNCKVEYIPGRANTCADLLLRIPSDPEQTKASDSRETKDKMDVDFDDRCFKINVLNSDKFNPKDYASCRVEFMDELETPEHELKDIDLVYEQDQDENISKLKKNLQSGEATKTEQERFII